MPDSTKFCPNCGSEDISVDEDSYFCEDCQNCFTFSSPEDAPDNLESSAEVVATI